MRNQSEVEIQIGRVHAVSRASVLLPFSVEDASRSDAEVEASQVFAQFTSKWNLPIFPVATFPHSLLRCRPELALTIRLFVQGWTFRVGLR